MLTVEEIRSIKFEKILRGYRPEAVQDFVDLAAAQIEKLLEEKEDLEKKLYILASKVEEYRSEEDMLKTAMINAQRMGENVIKEARQKAESIVREADLNAALINEKTKAKLDAEEERFSTLQLNISRFKEQVLAIYKIHIELLSELPSIEEDVNEDDIDSDTPTFFENVQPSPIENAQLQEPIQNEDDAIADDIAANSVDKNDISRLLFKDVDETVVEPIAYQKKNAEQIFDKNSFQSDNSSDLDALFGLSKPAANAPQDNNEPQGVFAPVANDADIKMVSLDNMEKLAFDDYENGSEATADSSLKKYKTFSFDD